jgi:adenine-specific DNA-methyltransferase
MYQQKFKDKSTNVEDESEEENSNNKGKKIKQENLNVILRDQIIEKIQNNTIKLLLQKKYKEDSKGNPVSVLAYHLNRFTAKNTRDYFIHKNLKKFLSEQLDYFIKSEVLDIETIEKERFLDKHITRAKVVREIGETIIDFLSQIEDFQKSLWEKKKFVIKTEYVITTDRIPEEFYDEIWENEEQKEEWKELWFEIPNKKEDLKNSKLPVDTKYFSSEFKEKLLEKLTEKADLDDLLDGLLIKSENWQALNTILNKYKGTIKTIYIDPPYNTGSDEFLYRDRYQHSSWLSMIENRLSLAKELISDDGVIFVSIDDHEVHHLRMIMDEIFGEENFVAQIIRITGSTRNMAVDIDVRHDYLPLYAKNRREIKINGLTRVSIDEFINPDNDPEGSWSTQDLTVRTGGYEYEIPSIDGTKIFKKRWRYSIDKMKVVMGGGKDDEFLEIYRKNAIKVNVKGREWFIVGKIVFKGSKNVPNHKKYLKDVSDITVHTIWDDIESQKLANENLIEIFEGKKVFDNPKPVGLIKKTLSISTNSNSVILDFFAGSGTTAHAVMKLNKEDGGKRKFILVEMADYFDTIIIPRIKKVAYSFNWKDGKPQDKDGIGVFFKYQYLEQYEDTLDNIELKEDQKAQELFKDEYLIKYFLDFETKDSPYLLNIENLKNPFVYKLKVNLSEVGEPQEVVVDIPETFNYLLGIKLKKIKKRKNNGKDYLFILGEKEGQTYAIVWRELSTNEEDAKKDKEFIKKELKDWKPQIVYVNCPEDTVLTPDFGDFQVEIRYIEPDFKKLMEV